MAFRTPGGIAVSYDCEDLIRELTRDILEFGKDLEVEVVTDSRNGVKIYKDYNFIRHGDEPDGFEFDLLPYESMERIKAMDLLKLYEEENEIL